MSNIDTQLEEIERALLLSIRSKLPQVLLDIKAEMVAPDTAFFTELGVDPVPETLLPDVATWIQGVAPFTLERPLGDFPVVSVVAYEHPASGDSDDGTGIEIDQGESIQTVTYVDLLHWNDDAATLNRQMKRYGKAIHRCVTKDMTLGMAASRSQASPAVQLSNVITMPKSDIDNEFAFFQGARMSYTFRTVVVTSW